MPILDRNASTLLVIDFQGRLMPVIEDGDAVIRNARRLLDAAAKLDVPCLFTEQNSAGLGTTVEGLLAPGPVLPKMTFDATRSPGLLDGIPAEQAVVVAGCEAHVCVLQTVLGLLKAGRSVHVIRDAIGSRRAENKEAAIRRMERNGAEVVTTEMVVFEWLETCEHPCFRDVVQLIK
ncbi:isochorismatase family protein [uncultured Jannaschia sp.]|uniref:isochorismatase family protein n=1 Tax=uncultured Jannaschia sp. TaxID=293347 RepID=UPI002635D977|nr:isochorismatase family protein [uncultured Jannaschia sp.]